MSLNPKTDMQRRDFLNIFNAPTNNKNAFPENPPSTKGLTPYTGDWGFEEASHLLRRTTFGPSLEQLNQVAAMDLDSAITLIFAPQPLPTPPLNANYPDDTSTPIGESWVGKPLNAINTNNHKKSRRKSILSWNKEVLSLEGISIREKMTLFWHNHFATESLTVPEAVYRHITLLRTHALGNFRQLTKEITVDAHMLKYLNGNENVKAEPNENYARELLELFTVAKGPLIGAGDYSTYTEQDVQAGAKILTGWRIKGQNSTDPNQPLEVYFNNAKHSQGTKTLSYHFDQATIAENGADEYKDFIDIIFQKSSVAHFIVTKLYRYFVYYDITPTVKQNIIEPLAQLLIDSNYEIKPVLEKLFKSEHFFDAPTRGCLIKNSIDFIESLFKQLNFQQPTDLVDKYALNKKVAGYQISLGMKYFAPPSVAGWKAYYQSPTYHRLWINPVTYQKRNAIKNIFIGNGISINQTKYKVDLISVIQLTSSPNNPVTVVDELTKLLLPLPVNTSLKLFLKTVLIPGLPDFEWTMEYNNYLDNPSDENIRKSLEKKIRNLLKAILELPEFQLS